MIEVAFGLMLLAGCWRAAAWRERRYVHYIFAFVAFEAFLSLGPRAIGLTLAAGTAGALAHVALSRASARAERGAGGPTTVPLSLGITTVAIAGGMVTTHALARAVGAVYPVPLASMASVAQFALLLTSLFATTAIFKEGLLRALGREEGHVPARELEAGASVYAIGAVAGAPLHYAAHPLFVRGLFVPWLAAMGWAFLLDAILRRELARDRQARALAADLARAERLSAVGEVTARIVHQTRHQLGLIGISAHRIGKRLGSLGGDDVAIVRAELAKLDEVQRELRGMLTRDLRVGQDVTVDAPRRSYAEILEAVARRVGSLAETRRVRLEVGPLDLVSKATPLHAEHVSQGFFNLLENALAAAGTVVHVEARQGTDGVVIAIRDDGPGMAPGVLARATEPFFTTKVDGTGMGLAIARAAFEEEGAVFGIANRDEGGCVVTVALALRAGP